MEHSFSKNILCTLTKSLIQAHLQWMEQEQFKSYDWWDIWGTKYGSWAKQLYVKNKFKGAPFVASLVLLDLIYPSFRSLFAEKRTFPICHAHIGMGFLNLFELTGEKKYLDHAIQLVPSLLQMASPLAHDLGWGMKHQWMTVQGLIPADTPCNTQTAYPYAFFIQLYLATKDEIYLSYLQKILKHVCYDFPEWKVDNKLICSYSTIDKRKVVNANCYRMYMLLDGGKRFQNQFYFEKGTATLRYILSMQNADGSWPYSHDQPFVDCYHTVFVLKNLISAKKIMNEDYRAIDLALEKGFKYFDRYLFDEKGFPKPFSVAPRFTMYKYDAYDLAECIGILSETHADLIRLERLIKFAKSNFFSKQGWFIFRLYRFMPFSRSIPYMRYANSAMFLAMTKALLSLSKND